MNASYLAQIAAAICALASVTLAEPSGFITFSIAPRLVDFGVGEVSVTGGPPRMLDYAGGTTYYGPFWGVDAPPFLGELSVMARFKPAGGVVGIALLDRTGGTHTVIATDTTNSTRHPGISFDGRRIAYVRRNSTPGEKDELHVLNSSGQFDSTIFTASYDFMSISRPRFHPDGKTIMFTEYNGMADYSSVYTIPVTGGAARIVTGLPVDVGQAVYSPDSRYIASIGDPGGAKTLYIGKTDGTPAQPVNLFGEGAYYPCFSPDSRYVVVGGDSRLNIVRVSDFSIVQRIVLTNYDYFGLCWHLGARQSEGGISKLKITRKKIAVKLVGFMPGGLPAAGLAQIDRTVIPLDTESLWVNKKDKKYLYKDKTTKRSAKIILKKGKATFAAKKLSLSEGDDYRVTNTVPVGINAGDTSIAETFFIDEKGRYKAK